MIHDDHSYCEKCDQHEESCWCGDHAYYNPYVCECEDK